MTGLEPIVVGGTEVAVDRKKRQVAIPAPKKGCGIVIAHSDHQKKSHPKNTKTSALTIISSVCGGGMLAAEEECTDSIEIGWAGGEGCLQFVEKAIYPLNIA